MRQGFMRKWLTEEMSQQKAAREKVSRRGGEEAKPGCDFRRSQSASVPGALGISHTSEPTLRQGSSASIDSGQSDLG